MSTVTVTKKNPIELRKAGLRVLNAALGHDNAQAFLRQYSGTGDFTKERHEQPDPSNEEIFAGIMRIQEEFIKGGKPFVRRGEL
jgi:hypothetical protein